MTEHPSSSAPMTRRQLRELRERQDRQASAQRPAAPDRNPAASRPPATPEERAPRTAPVREPAPRRPSLPPQVQLASVQNGDEAHRERRSSAEASGDVAPSPSPPTGDDVPTTTGGIEQLFGGDGPDAPKKRRRGGGCLVSLVVIIVILAGIAAGGAWAWSSFRDSEFGQQVSRVLGIGVEPADYEEGEATGEALVTISSGDTGYDVSLALHEAGVTRTETAFYDMLVAAQQNPEFQPGVYRLQQRMTSAAALDALDDPENLVEGAIGFPEGATIDAIIPTLASGLDVEEESVVDALSDPSAYGVDAGTLEGWLFPATYRFEPDTTPEAAIQTMVERTRQSLESAGVPEAEQQRVLTIASIVEREARVSDDFYRVARVIENRLDVDMLLQMDSTAQYGYGEMHDGDVYSSEEALNDDNGWNTYVHTGLPAGPISNPGDRAIDAAMNPAAGDWLYFVTVNLDSGETKFAATLDQHEAYVEELRAWCADNPDSGCGG